MILSTETVSTINRYSASRTSGLSSATINGGGHSSVGATAAFKEIGIGRGQPFA